MYGKQSQKKKKISFFPWDTKDTTFLQVTIEIVRYKIETVIYYDS